MASGWKRLSSEMMEPNEEVMLERGRNLLSSGAAVRHFCLPRQGAVAQQHRSRLLRQLISSEEPKPEVCPCSPVLVCSCQIPQPALASDLPGLVCGKSFPAKGVPPRASEAAGC